MNAEELEHAMDKQWAYADTLHKTCLYDAVQDARSEARYTDDPRAEPTLEDVKAACYFACDVDESGGLRGDVRGG